MKTQDEIIKEQIGISLDAIDTTPMDKGECKICMTAWAESEVKKLNKPQVIRWVAASDELPPLYKLGMSRDVLTIAGSKISVKSYDYELNRWNGSPHITVKYWAELPEPPCV